METHLTVGLVVALLAACSKGAAPDVGLPPATQVGANTGGCLINGEQFVASGWGGSLFSNPTPPLSGGFAFDSVYRVELHGQYQGQRASLMLFVRNDQVGLHPLNKITQYWPQGDPLLIASHAAFSFVDAGGDTYVTNAIHNGKVVLTRAEPAAKIGAGTFEFTAVSTSDPCKTITVTSGRFDRKQ